jgi:Uma2 family endonuclease
MQLELFPTYPRLATPKPYDLVAPDRSQAWKLFDYPTEDNEPMAQSKKQADTIVYLTGVFEAILSSMKQDYFIGADVFVYHTHTQRIRKAGKVKLKDQKQASSPDIFFAIGEGLQQVEEPESFILEKVKEETGGIIPRMVSVEILSKSNYKDKDDQKKRFKFQNELGVDEYIVVHTQPKMSLEVYWRLGGTLQRILFCEDDVYDFVMLGVRLEIKTTPKKTRKKGKPTMKYDLLVYDSTGSQFNNYGTEREIRQEAEAKLETLALKLREEQEERLAAEEEYLVAEEARLRAEAELKKERQARLRAEEQAREEATTLEEQQEEMRKLRFELEEAKRILEFQKNYKE